MIRALLILALTLGSFAPVLAGNARSERTARTFRQDQIRRGRINAQWSQRQRSLRQQRWVQPTIRRSVDPMIMLHEYPAHYAVPPGYLTSPTPLIRRPWPSGPRR